MAENEETSQACLFLICYCMLRNLFHMPGRRFRSLKTTGTGWKTEEKSPFPAGKLRNSMETLRIFPATSSRFLPERTGLWSEDIGKIRRFPGLEYHFHESISFSRNQSFPSPTWHYSQEKLTVHSPHKSHNGVVTPGNLNLFSDKC